jgi:pimeloyl-ACP methyl ester carboxylesterase
MLHGLAGDSRLFHNQIRYFSPSFRVIAPDLPGHGNSGNCPACSMDDYVDTVNAIIERENSGSSIILGHSMGGAVAMNYFFKNKSRVKSLILVSTSARFRIKPENIKAAEADFDAFYESFVKGTFSRKNELFLSAAKSGINPDMKKGILKGLEICSAINFTEKLKEITVPALLLGNRYDPILPVELTTETGKNIKGSKTVIFDKSGHVPFFEEPETFNREVESFINSL